MARPDKRARQAIASTTDLYRVHVPLPWIRDLFGDASATAPYAGSAHAVLRRRVASLDLAPELVERLADDGNRAVGLLLAKRHQDAPADLLLRVALDGAGYLESR
ncbi:hypothetical protein AB0J35_47800 [Nonomuraea angiospora]|uniref:hypothetical protein n=1 Tax=Nonomuraea angiospora TaxID=46172 RepID=UPI003434DF44